MIKTDLLVQKFQYALDHDWGYIFGKSGQKWTQAQQDAATREQTVKWGQRWVGHNVADCSGLFVRAFEQLGGSIYHGSNTIWNKYCSKQGKLVNGKRSDGYALKPGTAVFLLKGGNRHHIGLYIGNGLCIEAKGTYYGVVTSSITHWDEWGELKDIDYSDYSDTKDGDPIMVTLRRGDSGAEVRELQLLLNNFGYGLDGDGKFGTKTENAVKAFQQSHWLTADGIVGEKTWAALKDDNGVSEPSEGFYAMPIESAIALRKALLAALEIMNQADWGDA